MKKNLFGTQILIIFLILFTFLPLLFGQDLLIKLKDIYNYDAWQGKTGEIKLEPTLELLNLPGFVFIDKSLGDEGTTYKWGETLDNAQIQATVKTYTTIEEAQTGLINILSQYSMILSKAEDQGLMVGDIGFVISENDTIVFVAFVKNNITVVAKNVDGENPISVKDLTIQINSSI